MTEQRIREIMANPAKHESESDTPNEYVYRLIKQAVNEALEMAADVAEVQIKPKQKPIVLRDKNIPIKDWTASVYKQSILNLKVK